MNTLADLQHPDALKSATTALDLFHVPVEIRFRTPLAPEAIETFEDTEKTRIEDPAKIAEFFAALAAAAPKPSRTSVEYRWKAVAYDASGERILELYASAISRLGRIGENTAFEFTSDAFATMYKEMAGTEVAPA